MTNQLEVGQGAGKLTRNARSVLLKKLRHIACHKARTCALFPLRGLSRELERISAGDSGCARLRRIPGIGPIVGTAIVAAIGNGTAFRKGRDFAAWLGVVPRQYSTGGKTRLLGISKRGNVYLRKVLIHGARAAVLRMKRDRAPIGAWLDALDARAPKNVVVVAMANKLARIAWAVLSSGEDYKPASNLVTAS